MARWTGSTPELEVPQWVTRCRVGEEGLRWRAVRVAAGADQASSGENRLSDLAEVVRLTCEETLGVPVVDPGATFYELGGQSLTLVRLTAELSDLLGTEVSLADVFGSPTVRELADLLSGRPSAQEMTARSRQILEALALSDSEVRDRLAVMTR